MLCWSGLLRTNSLQARLLTLVPPRPCAEVNSILSDTMGILQQFLAASTAASGGGRYAGGTGMLPSSASELQPSDPFR